MQAVDQQRITIVPSRQFVPTCCIERQPPRAWCTSSHGFISLLNYLFRWKYQYARGKKSEGPENRALVLVAHLIRWLGPNLWSCSAGRPEKTGPTTYAPAEVPLWRRDHKSILAWNAPGSVRSHSRVMHVGGVVVDGQESGRLIMSLMKFNGRVENYCMIHQVVDTGIEL